jgi:hypothetical protein
MEIITGLWLGQAKQTDNLEWCQEKKIKSILNCNKLFETIQPIEINYVYLDKVDEFAKKATEKIIQFHYNENKNVIVVCDNGRRISLIVLIYYLSTICNISRNRAFEIIKTKLPTFTLDPYIIRYIN